MFENNKLAKKINDMIYGVACGDALGNPVQFKSRAFVKKNPVKEMISGGAYHSKAGTWTDDTSLTLCLAASLGEKGEPDYLDIMNSFHDWFYKGKWTPDKKAFDVGMTCGEAIYFFDKGEEPLDCGGKLEDQNGNGSLMRISPIVFYINKKFGGDAFSSDDAFDVVHKVSSLTHAHKRSLLGCDIYVTVLLEILNGTEKSELLKKALPKIGKYVHLHKDFEIDMNYYSRICSSDFAKLSEDDIQSSGYVVHSLEAALWCFLNSESYEECVLKAVNLGYDADSVGAISGGLAGLYYSGTDKSIPENFMKQIRGKMLIDKAVEKMCSSFVGKTESL